MFVLKARERFRKMGDSTRTATPPRRKWRLATKLRLEALEDRTLPSVSASTSLAPVSVDATQVAADTSYTVSAMQQLSSWIATAEQNLIGDYQVLTQEIGREVASVWEQLGSLIAINPAQSNPSLATAVPQTGTGVSNATTAPHESTRTQPSIRMSSIQSPDGPNLVGIDEYLWDPQNPANDISASNASNWLKNGVRGGVPGTKPSDIATFDPGNGLIHDGNGNSDIKWDINRTFSTMHVGGVGVYTGKQTIQSGITIELTGANTLNISLDMPNASSNLYLDFQDATSVFQIDNYATITNMNLTGVSTGQFIVAGGTTTMAQSTSYTEKLGVQFTVNVGATVDDESYTPIQLTAGNTGALIITIKGTMYFHWGPNNGIQLISGGGTYPADFIGVYGGFLGYYGTQDVKDTLTVPVDVRSGGTFRVSIDVNSPNPQNGWLVVQGAAPDGEGPSVYMTGASSSVQLAYSDTLECDSGYVQDDGELMTTDATKCWLQVGANKNGTANINGGSLIINRSNMGYGNLVVSAATLNFNGELVS